MTPTRSDISKELSQEFRSSDLTAGKGLSPLSLLTIQTVECLLANSLDFSLITLLIVFCRSLTTNSLCFVLPSLILNYFETDPTSLKVFIFQNLILTHSRHTHIHFFFFSFYH